ncbi:MAG: hypothetical protein LBS82_02800, partial [Spirochaetaceae bacterium]|nr:hypothetical protein [Spirochaetaceae bacterium]
MPVKKKPVKKAERETPHVFDGAFKQLMRLSNKATVSFINGIFGTRHPPDSEVVHLNIETVNGKMRRRLRDAMLEINGVP